MVLIMTVEPGFGGQKFMESMMPKVCITPKFNVQMFKFFHVRTLCTVQCRCTFSQASNEKEATCTCTIFLPKMRHLQLFGTPLLKAVSYLARGFPKG